jgi:hypothetical protein
MAWAGGHKFSCTLRGQARTHTSETVCCYHDRQRNEVGGKGGCYAPARLSQKNESERDCRHRPPSMTRSISRNERGPSCSFGNHCVIMSSSWISQSSSPSSFREHHQTSWVAVWTAAGERCKDTRAFHPWATDDDKYLRQFAPPLSLRN